MYNQSVANQRAKNRQVVAFWLDDEWIAAMDACREMTHMDRSTFIRKALAAELEKGGKIVDKSKIYPPDRTGTPRPGSGRRKKHAA